MGSKYYEGGSDLDSTLGITGHIFGDFEPMYWQSFSFTVPHHAWMGHILLSHSWEILRKSEALPDDMKESDLHSDQILPPPQCWSWKTVCSSSTSCLGFYADDLPVVEKR